MSGGLEPITWDQILELVTRLSEGEIAEASIQVGDVSVRMSKDGPLSTPDHAPPTAASPPVGVVVSEPAAPPSAPTGSGAASAPPAGTAVPAPIVGIFYRAPSPGADPFVAEGDLVDPDRPIGIIEVMKMMNPVTAGVAGRLVSFAVSDGDAVEFAQPLAYIEESP